MIREWINLVETGETDFLPEHLFHGTDASFEEFDRSKARTARHIYTSPDPETASFYGKNVFQCEARGPQADLTGDDVESSKLIHRLAEIYADRFYDAVNDDETLKAIRQQLMAESDDPDISEWDVEDDPRYTEAREKTAVAFAYQVFTDGKVYEYDMRGNLQDSILDEVFSWGYKSIRFIDHNSQGQSLSVVIDNADDVKIIGKLI